jgi:hypothetical protein
MLGRSSRVGSFCMNGGLPIGWFGLYSMGFRALQYLFDPFLTI